MLLIVAVAGCVEPRDAPGPSQVTPVFREAIVFETDAGAITVMLYPEAAPMTVQLMRTYVAEGYYVGRGFGRTVPGHVIQVADASGESTEDGRRVPLETSTLHHFSAGAAGIARGDDPGSGGPEFFIMDYATSHLDGNYTVWGQVVAGMDVVHDIARTPTVAAPAVPAPAPNPFPFDRMAVQPVLIRGARLATIELEAAEAARYPLQVARNVREGNLRHTLDYPANLQAGEPARLVWYIRASDQGDVPDQIELRSPGNGTIMMAAPRPGIYPFTWTPTGNGTVQLVAYSGAHVLARLVVQVGPAG